MLKKGDLVKWNGLVEDSSFLNTDDLGIIIEVKRPDTYYSNIEVYWLKYNKTSYDIEPFLDLVSFKSLKDKEI